MFRIGHRRIVDEDGFVAFVKSAALPVTVIDRPGAASKLRENPAPATLVDNLSRSPTAALKRARRLFWHVRQGGHYVIAAPNAAVASEVQSALQHLVSTQPGPVPVVRPQMRRELRRAIGSIERQGRLVVIEKVGQSLFKVGEAEASLVVNRTALEVEVVERREASDFSPERRVTVHGLQPGAELTKWTVPASELRRHSGAITLDEGMVVRTEATLLPASFKWFEHEPLSNSQLRDITPRFARLRNPSLVEPQRLPGSYYLFEYKNSGHYGHLLTEGLAKLWGWELAKGRDPDVRLAVRRHKRDRGRPIVRPDSALLEAFGVAPDDIVWLEAPVTVDTLFTATPQLHNKQPYSVDPRIGEVWDRVRDGLLKSAPTTPSAKRIFITRRSGHRLCHNWAEVEHEFQAAGLTVVEPSKLSIPQQARLFSDAEVVGGFGGTGMFNLIFATQSPTVVMLGHSAYDARNEELITAVRGCDIHYIWSEPDHHQPADGFDYQAFQSSWTFDLPRRGPELRKLLQSLE